jgi:hypothetical protein
MTTDLGVKSIELSADGSALVVNKREKQALCHFCGSASPFTVPISHPLNGSLFFNKPNKWALIYGGTRKAPKRFFICESCAKEIVHHSL